MKLKPEEAGLFYEMFLPLLDYVNENYHVTMVHFTGERVDPGEAAEVAQFLWERTWIIDDYLAGAVLPEEQCEIILSWKRCVSGTFIIERHLKKKGSIFISDDNNSVYLVNGIIDSWEEMFGHSDTDDRKGNIASIPGCHYFGWAGVCIPDSIWQKYGR